MNNSDTSNERRQDTRYPMATSLQFHHGPSKREVPARSVDVSDSGMLMYVPATTPVRAGQSVYVNMAGISGRSAATAGPVQATIVRVDRADMTSKGYLGVGVRFAAA
ncbi:MAG: PilZ domain-containing protein [Phycisphaerae bacterium]|nr:PilZ domain-containing protein [Phycisphaerae bacterium]